jgi:hypothetical protein
MGQAKDKSNLYNNQAIKTAQSVLGSGGRGGGRSPAGGRSKAPNPWSIDEDGRLIPNPDRISF